MTGVVGGMIRDVLVGEMPLVLRKEIYATASFFGASALLLLDQWNVSLDIAILVSIVITLSLRVLAIIYTIELPVFVSYQPKIPNSEGSKEAKNDANQSDSKNESNNLY